MSINVCPKLGWPKRSLFNICVTKGVICNLRCGGPRRPSPFPCPLRVSLCVCATYGKPSSEDTKTVCGPNFSAEKGEGAPRHSYNTLSGPVCVTANTGPIDLTQSSHAFSAVYYDDPAGIFNIIENLKDNSLEWYLYYLPFLFCVCVSVFHLGLSFMVVPVCDKSSSFFFFLPMWMVLSNKLVGPFIHLVAHLQRYPW